MIAQIWGRLWQGIQVLTAWLRPVRDDLAQQYLSIAEFALFMQMPRPDRQHHLRVLADLLKQGHQHPALLKAALLHDVGKSRYPFRLPEKTLVVLVKNFLPGKFRTWSQSPPQGWKRPFVISAHHPAWSAEMAAAAGMEVLPLELIARHQEKLKAAPQTEADQLLLLLQAADDRS